MNLSNIFEQNDYDEIKESLDKYVKRLQENNAWLREQLSNFNKDEELEKLQKEYKDYRKHVLIDFSDVELKRYRDFRDKHYKKCNNGNRYIYTLTGCGIGTAIEIKCPICGEEEDITDVESW